LSGFTADWLALREPADETARAERLTERLRRNGPKDGEWRIVDLGSGTGANLRYLAPRIGGRQEWLLVDDDAALLARAGEENAPSARASAVDPDAVDERVAGTADSGRLGACRIRRVQLDLAASHAAIAWPIGGLVTASALLDLVSASWLEALARHASEAHANVLFALTYDGRMDLSPAEPEDAEVRSLVNAHQRRDKGFGPALGPAAAETAVRCLEDAGYAVETARSDWRLEHEQRSLQAALLEGWRSAAAEMTPACAARLDDWCRRRLAHVAAGVSELVVGHVDLLGLAAQKTRAKGGSTSVPEAGERRSQSKSMSPPMRNSR
jgi:SAM-dependent methyltransferase